MKLDYIKVVSTYKDINKVKHLFEHAFPSVERPPFWVMKENKNHLMFAIEDDSTFIGLVDLVIYEDLSYIFFLAIKKTYRGKGYGSKVLEDIKNKYQDKRLYLLAEDIDGDYPNIEERKKRLAFYKKNGFTLSDIKISEFEVIYRVLYINKEVNKEDFLKGMEYFLGKKRYLSFYIKNVK